MVVAGKANKVVACELGISQKTVETHRARVMAKLEVGSLAELVRLDGVAWQCVSAAADSDGALLRERRPRRRAAGASRSAAGSRSMRTSSASEVAPSLCMTRARCASTVFSLMPNSMATTLLALPCTTSWKTSCSRAVRQAMRAVTASRSARARRRLASKAIACGRARAAAGRRTASRRSRRRRASACCTAVPTSAKPVITMIGRRHPRSRSSPAGRRRSSPAGARPGSGTRRGPDRYAARKASALSKSSLIRPADSSRKRSDARRGASLSMMNTVGCEWSGLHLSSPLGDRFARQGEPRIVPETDSTGCGSSRSARCPASWTLGAGQPYFALDNPRPAGVNPPLRCHR